MSLRRNATEFAERVRAAPISGNIDNPEGGFDALMQVRWRNKDGVERLCCLQVIVCEELVGWREDARRVVIYTTDQVRQLGERWTHIIKINFRVST